MQTTALDNLFPKRLQRSAMTFFAADALGAALVKQPAVRPEPEGQAEMSWPVPAVARLVHRREYEQALEYRFAKRRNEFLAGRIAARLALMEYSAAKGCHLAPTEVEIVNDPSGRPAVSLESPPRALAIPDISISHGGIYGAALAADAPCGIDLQEQRDSLLRVRDRYCLDEEDRILCAFLPAMAPTARLSLLWTAKEAAKKACSCRWMPGFLDLRLGPPVRRHDDWHVLHLALARAPGQSLLPARLDVLVTDFHSYGLALCILNEASRHA